MHALWFVCSEHHGRQQAALNDFDLNTNYKTAVEFTYEELMTQRKGKSAAPDRRNMGYYAASQALRVRGKGGQIKWHPAVRAYFTGAHADPRDETGTEVPEDISDTMIEAWASENAAEQAVLVAFAASLHAATGIPYSDHSGVGCRRGLGAIQLCGPRRVARGRAPGAGRGEQGRQEAPQGGRVASVL